MTTSAAPPGARREHEANTMRSKPKRGRAEATALARVARSVSPVTALAPLSGVSSAQLGFMDGTDGKPSMTWSRTPVSYFTSGYGPWYGAPGAEVSRERSVAASITTDMLTSNSVVATLVENFATYAIGNGLTLSARPNAALLGISPEAARALSHEVETKWGLWANNPVECDASQRHNLHQLATASFKSWLLTGESSFLLDWRKGNGAVTRTKVKLIDSRQIDQSITRVTDDGCILQGVQFDKVGRMVGYWIRPFVLGNFSSAPQPIYVAARTTWGRARAMHIFDLLTPGQIRGLSPIIAALTAAHAKGTHREFTLAAALIQTMIATTIESDMPTRQALGQFQVNDGLQGYGDGGTSPEAWAKGKGDFYGEAKIQLQPGVVSHLYQGDKFKIHRAETPNGTYDSFDKSLGREAAKAAGSSAEDLSGDYSQTSFSASRLAQELPSRINDRRRMAIVQPFYQTVFASWLEEQMETGAIKLPDGAPEFWQAKDAYCNAIWRGKGKPTSDPLKTAQADVLELESGLTTLEAKLGERGLDFEEIIAQRKAEREALEAAGLPYLMPKTQAALIATNSDDEAALK
jgi:lambda family phage portal protein